VNRSVITSLTLTNFGPYRGEQQISLGGGQDPLVLVHGENMSGKTSFLNSVRWLLYGSAKDRSGRSMPIRKLLNDDAFAANDLRLSVEAEVRLSMGAVEQTVNLKRQSQAKGGIAVPSADGDFSEHLSIDVDGNVVAASEFDDWVNFILPEDISRFFLFDGELLNEYEELVREDETVQATRVKQAIEQILGVPAARNGRTDIAQIHKETRRKYNREAKEHGEAREAAEKLEKLNIEIDRLEEDRAAIGRQSEDAHGDLKGYEAELRRYQDLREDAGRLEEIVREIEGLVASQDDRRIKVQSAAKDLWRDALTPRLRHEIGRLEAEQSEVNEALDEHAQLSRRLNELNASLERATCPTCGQVVPEETKARLRTEQDDVNKALADVGPKADRERQSELATAISRLRSLAPAGVISGIRALEGQIQDSTVTFHKRERERDKIKDRLRGLDPGAILEYERKQRQTQTRIATLTASIASLDDELATHKAEASRLDRQIKEQDLPGLRVLREQARLLEQAEALFDQAIADLISDLRKDVQEAATSIFLQLTTDKSYKGLQINENYWLTILGPDGREISVRSAGAEQVVALSLIGALNQLAAQKGPVIMDTPFGRLDRGHRANILRFVPTLGEQVVLLVHGGEVDRDEDLGEIAKRIDRQYEIRHETATTSHLVAVGGRA
jgi:DNA sulfur modification protein DndD